VLSGMLLRKTRFFGRTATALIAFGLIICYLFGIGILTLTVMPFAFQMVDQQLMAIDGALGFNWHDDVTALAAYPAFATGLRWVYQSILPQIAFVIVLLAALKHDNDLHRFLAVGMLSMTVSMVIWWLWPSVGPAAYKMVSEQVQISTSLVADAHYGEKMWRYATQGNPVISRASMAGVVAFPSMHIVMMAMVLLFTRKTWAFGPLLVLNATMPMATILQGGHHAIDLVGGMLVFFACVAVVNMAFPDAPGGLGMLRRGRRCRGLALS
jgi:membrane-associated phospholipid phosphatase